MISGPGLREVKVKSKSAPYDPGLWALLFVGVKGGCMLWWRLALCRAIELCELHLSWREILHEIRQTCCMPRRAKMWIAIMENKGLP